MRNPERVLNSLSEHSKVSSYKFERLYRVLFNSEMFLLAYHNIQGRQGNMTEGSDGKTIDGMSLKRIENLIDALKDESYQPKPARRTYIPKKNGNMRLGFVFSGFSAMIATYEQATDSIMPGVVVQLLRQGVLLVPVIWLLNSAVQMTGIWLAFPITEFVTFLVAVVFAKIKNH